jgi:hypothetical protein
VAVDGAAIEVDGSATYYQVRYEHEAIHDMGIGVARGAPLRPSDVYPDFFVPLDPDDLEAGSQSSFTLPFAIQGALFGAGFGITIAIL